ncbi:hypothetical protein BDB00DRAFT_876821 [Zychaea mexicana]|uniref:uncharacterized protein n=1 Tax=Zychaea mexicana TaxID=64656 RepID=UPI0022FF31B2|nr:uncharacterized protein BDB00DRAFT_876821 [Zychaea mexicana]KAI9489038.1 hypothetical protein BDB00DRAFT_876821 [Zychaea mexicana]
MEPQKQQQIQSQETPEQPQLKRCKQLLLTVDEVLDMIPSRQSLRNVADSLEDYSLDAYVQLDDDMLALSDSQLVINIRDRIQAGQAAIRSRLYRRMATFLCNGRISGMVDRVNGYFHLNIEHSCGHRAAPAVENYAVPQNVRAYIAANAIDLDAQQLHRNIIRQFQQEATRITQGQVYYWACQSIQDQYTLHNNQFSP